MKPQNGAIRVNDVSDHKHSFPLAETEAHKPRRKVRNFRMRGPGGNTKEGYDERGQAPERSG